MSEVLPDIRLGPVSQIPPGEGRRFAAGGRVVAVFRTRAGALFATEPDCPHRGGPLADGMVGGRLVVCPLHERQFDLQSGQEVGGDCRLATYPIRSAPDGTMLLTLPG